ncbi:MAG: hypothetical protein K0S28_1861, partial [Paucimonas sp.]|nr:hypothetical protein [Paucimonas sp.]
TTRDKAAFTASTVMLIVSPFSKREV